jgi:hypothetical protein
MTARFEHFDFENLRHRRGISSEKHMFSDSEGNYLCPKSPDGRHAYQAFWVGFLLRYVCIHCGDERKHPFDW